MAIVLRLIKVDIAAGYKSRRWNSVMLALLEVIHNMEVKCTESFCVFALYYTQV
jgi:hypothetical protein